MTSLFSKALRASIFALSASCAFAAPALVGHSNFAGQTLDAETVKAVLLGKRVAIGDTRVVIVIAKTSEAQEAFLKKHAGMTGSQFQNHWRRLFMTGGGSAPKVVDDEAAALKLAAETPGAVAIGESANAGSLAVLATD
jgi:hypothetical protein